ncbi:pyridoxal phosphate-dependent transferase [Gongronella butleri]|nr:pyridoxal phosphate-dependent transferase [Gongronella butleri]
MNEGCRAGHLSHRGDANLRVDIPLRKKLIEALPRCYHPTLNPSGAINMGLAHNSLCEKEMLAKIQACLQCQIEDLDYGDPHGTRRLRGLCADLVNRHFLPAVPLHFHNVTVVPGAGAAVWQLVQALADAGDEVLVLTPYYGNFDLDVCISSGVALVALDAQPDLADAIDEQALERALAASGAKRPKAMLVTNPGNPYSQCYTLSEIHSVLKFASRHHLHVIFDEVYALSTFAHVMDTSVKPPEKDAFVSVLSLANLQQWIDPQLVHVIYGLSKDFGLNGLRVGLIIDQYNEPLQQTVTLSSMFGYMSTLNDRVLCNLLQDTEWIDNFVATNRRRLGDAYGRASLYLREKGYDVREVGAGLFVMVDLLPLFERHGKAMTWADEDALWSSSLDQGVYVAAGHVFHTARPGYFRLTISLDWPLVQRGMDAFDTTVRSHLASA